MKRKSPAISPDRESLYSASPKRLMEEYSRRLFSVSESSSLSSSSSTPESTFSSSSASSPRSLSSASPDVVPGRSSVTPDASTPTPTLSRGLTSFSIEAILRKSPKRKTPSPEENRALPLHTSTLSPFHPANRLCSQEVALPPHLPHIPYSPSATPPPHPLSPSEASPNVPASRSDSPVCVTGRKTQLSLVDLDLWNSFHKFGTEMIVTNSGRRMFPPLRVKVSGIDPDSYYAIALDLIQTDKYRYRYVYQNSSWVATGNGETLPDRNLYAIPIKGENLVKQIVSFDKVKLTNAARETVPSGQIRVHSMQKYQPRVSVVRIPSKNFDIKTLDLESFVDDDVDKDDDIGDDIDVEDDAVDSPKLVARAAFPQTVFYTVTAYQNHEVTKLKIASNPFAKGFRETESKDPDFDYLRSNSSPAAAAAAAAAMRLHHPQHISLPTSLSAAAEQPRVVSAQDPLHINIPSPSTSHTSQSAAFSAAQSALHASTRSLAPSLIPPAPPLSASSFVAASVLPPFAPFHPNFPAPFLALLPPARAASYAPSVSAPGRVASLDRRLVPNLASASAQLQLIKSRMNLL